LNLVREIICTILEEKFGMERTSKVVGKTKGGKDIVKWENPGDYVDRVCAEQNLLTPEGNADLTSLQAEVDTACREFKDEDGTIAALAVDIKGVERKAPQPKKLPAKYKITAARILAAGNVQSFNTKRLVSIGKSFTETGDTTKMFTATFEDKDKTQKTVNVSDKDAEALGWLVREYNDWKVAQDLADQAGD
jgi:hypothetical protein